MSAMGTAIWSAAAALAWLVLYAVVSLRHGRPARLAEMHWLGSLVAALLAGAVPALLFDLSASRPVELPASLLGQPGIDGGVQRSP